MQSFETSEGNKLAQLVDRHAEPASADAPPYPQARARAGERAHHRGDEPGRRSRSGAVASGPLRSLDPLRPAEPFRPARDHRLLPRPQGARARARQGGAARRARGDDLRVLAGDARAHLRRSARVGVARRPDRDELGARAAGEDDRGDRAEAARRVHRRRAAHDRHARSRSRDGRVSRRSESQARGAVDHQAPRRARLACRTATARRSSRARVPSCSG